MITDVIRDIHGGGMWRFDDAANKYIRLQEDGTVSGLIEGRFLPDPAILWQARLDRADVARSSDAGQAMKPAPATFALWDHWQGVKNAECNA